MKVYRAWIERDNGIRKQTFGVWTVDISIVLNFIDRHENETVYLEIY